MGLVITRTARRLGLPLNAGSLRTGEGGQVAGLGRAAVQRILKEHGIARILAEEGGRTSRGSLGLMREYVAVLNELYHQGEMDLEGAELWWVDKVQLHFASDGPRFRFDPGKSLHANIEDLLVQAEEVQSNSGGTNYVGAMLQHLVGAKLDLVVGRGRVKHHGFSVADHATERRGDFHVEGSAIHVTTHPSEALVRKCADNLREGLKPLILTYRDGVQGARFLLRSADCEDRVDVLDAAQFLTANVWERSLLQAEDCRTTLGALLSRYNEIVSACETDPVLRVNLGSPSPCGGAA